MNFKELEEKLQVTNGTLSITKNMLTQGFDDILQQCYFDEGRQLVISQAKIINDETATDTITLEGFSSFLKVANLPVRAVFSLDAQQEVQAGIRYTLIGDTPTPNSWHFSQSFPQLPGSTSTTVLLNSLILFNTSFVVSTSAQPATGNNLPLQKGINFNSQVRPQNLFGLFQRFFTSTAPLSLYGSIVIPADTSLTLPLKPFEQPWNTQNVPGICLQCDLTEKTAITEKIELVATAFRIYTPLTSAWYARNPSYMPATAIVGALLLQAPLSTLAMTVFLPSGDIQQAAFVGQFEGLTLNTLSDLADLAGPDDLMEHLPDQIKSLKDGLGKIQLINAGITIYLHEDVIAISSVFFTIGIPDIDWSPIPGVFTVNGISARLDIISPFSSPQIDIGIFGSVKIAGIDVDLYAFRYDGYTIYAQLADKEIISLDALLAPYAPNLPRVADLSIDDLGVVIAPGRYHMMQALLAGQPSPWVLPLGPVDLVVSDVTLVFSKSVNEDATGSFGGSIALGNYAQFSFLYDVPGDFILRADLPEIKLKQLLEVLTNQAVAIPDVFDLDFINSSVLIRKEGDNYIFQMATDLEGFGLLALQVQKVNTQWGVAFGLDMLNGMPSSLQGMSFLSKFEDLFSLTKLLLVVSSFDAPAFNFPDTASFNNPALGAKRLQLPAQAASLVGGLNFFGQWAIDTNDKKQKLLQQFLGTDPTLGITLQVSKNPADSSKLFVSYQATVMNHPMFCMFGGEIIKDEIGLFLTGSITVDIQGNAQTFDVTMLFVENGAFLSATMKGTTAVDFTVFKLSNLALEIGISWEGIPSFGVAGTIDVAKFESSIAVFFDSAMPSKSVVAGAISDLTLADILDTLTGNILPSEIDDVLEKVSIKGTHYFDISGTLASDLDNLVLGNVAAECLSKGGVTIPTAQDQVLLVVNTPGQVWYLTDMTLMRHYAFKKKDDSINVSIEAQFYCAPQSTYIGSILFQQGFYVNAAIDIFGFQASATIDISANKGISIDAQMDPIVIGDKRLFSLTAAQGDGGPQISVSTFINPTEQQPEFQAPHFYINGQIEILGSTKSAFVNITKNGGSFDLKGDLVPSLVKGKLTGLINGLTDMTIGGSLNVGIDDIDLGALGKFPIETGADCTVDFFVKATGIGTSLSASFELASERMDLGTINLDVTTQTLKDLPSILFNAIKDFLENLFKDPKEWAKYAVDALGWAKDKVEGVLTTVFPGLSKDAADAILNVVSPVCAMTTALQHLV